MFSNKELIFIKLSLIACDILSISVCYSIIKVGCSACGIGYTEFGLIDNTYFPEYPKKYDLSTTTSTACNDEIKRKTKNKSLIIIDYQGFILCLVIRLGYEPNVISSSISVLSEILALYPSRFSP